MKRLDISVELRESEAQDPEELRRIFLAMADRLIAMRDVIYNLPGEVQVGRFIRMPGWGLMQCNDMESLL